MINARGIFKGDIGIWAVYFLLLVVSIVEEFSAASSLAYKSGNYWSVFYSHAAMLGAGFFLLWAIHNIPCRYFKVVPLFGLPIIIVTLICTLVFGHTSNEGARWLSILGVQLQPSEFAKPILITTVALFLSYNQQEESADPRVFKSILVTSGIICGLILTQNFSTAVLIGAIVYIMLIIGRIPMRIMMKFTAVLIGIGALFVLLLLALPRDSALFKTKALGRALTWKNRITTFSEEKPATDTTYQAAVDSLGRTVNRDSIAAAQFPIADKAQVGHANIAISSANIIGTGPGNSVQRDFLSQAFSDFIYAIIIEELGIAGGIAVLFLYISLLFRAARIANRCERNFPAFLILGLAIWITLQALLNMSVAVGLIPVTGQTLPLISRGGSSIFSVSIAFGMMLSVSRYARKRKDLPADDSASEAAIEDADIEANFEDEGTME